MYDETIKQYAERRIREIAAEYGNTTLRELRLLYPRSWFETEYINLAREAARAGEVLTPKILDQLYQIRTHVFWSLIHDWPKAMPDNYLNPATRTKEKESRDAGRLGQAAAVKAAAWAIVDQLEDAE